MQIIETHLKGCYVFEPKIFVDERGFFYESYQKKNFEKLIGEHINFVQDNYSYSKKGVLRGLHFQVGEFAQSKLVQVINGEVLDVIVDLRKKSKTFGHHLKLKLSSQNKKIIFIPKGMAHGFLALSEETVFTYKCDAYYNAASEGGIIYNDNYLKIDWEYPLQNLILSEKDKQLPTFKELYP